MHEVAVGAVQLDDVKAQARGPRGGIDEGALHLIAGGVIERQRRAIGIVEFPSQFECRDAHAAARRR